MTGPVRRVAQYLRMSTEHQRYSLECQSLTNAAYALTRSYEIVQTFTDSGVSGLTLSKRDGLKALLAQVLGGAAGFEAVLVYDVSRWGRFQDPDQAAHYEFICREAGVRLEYTAEPFENDGSLTSALVKQLKRAMAAEYSRELSAKVSQAHQGLRGKGYWTGGPCGYGLRRQLIRPDGKPGAVMQTGEHKALQGYRTVLVHGPPDEIATVRQIFRLCGERGLKPMAIAKIVDREGLTASGGRTWTAARVTSVLRNEAFAGVIVGRRSRFHLRQRTPVPPADWVRIEGALPEVVSRRLFKHVQANLLRYRQGASDEALLAELRNIWRRQGRLSTNVINATPGAHCAAIHKKRFGGLVAAYARIGYRPTSQQIQASARAATHRRVDFRKPRTPPSEAELVSQLKALLRQAGRLDVALISRSPECWNAPVYARWLGGMRRAYALAGYKPSVGQERSMLRRTQSISAEAAEHLRESVLSGPENLRGGHQAEQQHGYDEHAPSRGAGLEPTSQPDDDGGGAGR